MVVCTKHLLKGFVAGGGDEGLLGAPMVFLFKELGIDGGQMQVYMAVAVSPWALKPVLGLISDACPLGGYRKIPYMILATSFGLAAVVMLGLRGAEMGLMALVWCLFLVFLQVATIDLLVEAKQSAEVRLSAGLGPDFYLFTWLGIVLGMIAAALLVGPLIQYGSAESCYLVAVPFMILPLYPIIMNYLGEEPLTAVERRGRFLSIACAHPELCCLSIVMGSVLACIVAVTLVSGKDSEELQVIVSSSAAVFLFSAFAIFIRWEATGPMIFWFLLAASPKVDGALFYFYTDGPEVFPGGPHFSSWLYATGLSLATFLGFLCGYLSGSELFRHWRYPGILLSTVPLRAVVRLFLLPVLLRWNTTRFNSPDVLWIFPVEFLSSMIYSWSWIPKQVMNAHMTVTGYEAMMLALIAGTFNMGSMISSYLGCWLLSIFNVCADGDSGDAVAFLNLWKPYLVSVLAPVLALLFMPWLIPNKLQTETLIDTHPESTTHGAPFQRWKRDRWTHGGERSEA
jgi:hypothetical protein